MKKTYDRAYFDRWYRAPGAVVKPETVRRKVRLALSAAEYVLSREVRTVLDVGCGEAPWRGELRRLRPGLDYAGVDSSEYVVARYGTRRHIVQGDMRSLPALRLRRFYDLIVCADVLEYVPSADMRIGLAEIARRLRGVAYIEAFTNVDDVVGDRDGWHHRTPSMYRSAFRQAGLISCGLNCYIAERTLRNMNALELAESRLG